MTLTKTLSRKKYMSDTVKDSSKGLTSKTKLASVNPSIKEFISNEHQAFLVRKSERLASALYVITGFVPQDEPVRTRLRACALDLIHRSTDKESLKGPGAEAFGSTCVEITNILGAAQSGGLISAMNAKLIADEYTALASFVRDNQETIIERDSHVQEGISEPQPAPVISLGHSSRTKNKAPIKINTKIRLENSNGTSKTERRSIVLNTIPTAGGISIKDVSLSLPEYGEKTIQRELLRLVREGALVKEGERRWSTYRKA